jgi:hypothetical protein
MEYPFPSRRSKCKGFFSHGVVVFVDRCPRKCRSTKISERTKTRRLVAVASEGLACLAVNLGVLLGVGQLSLRQLLALVVCGTLGLAALLESVVQSERHSCSCDERQYTPLNNILVLPADLVAQTADSAVLAAGLQSQDTEGLGNDHLLLLVVGGRDTLEDLESLKGGGTPGGLVGNHATDGLVEDPRRGAEVEGT